MNCCQEVTSLISEGRQEPLRGVGRGTEIALTVSSGRFRRMRGCYSGLGFTGAGKCTPGRRGPCTATTPAGSAAGNTASLGITIRRRNLTKSTSFLSSLLGWRSAAGHPHIHRGLVRKGGAAGGGSGSEHLPDFFRKSADVEGTRSRRRR